MNPESITIGACRPTRLSMTAFLSGQNFSKAMLTRVLERLGSPFKGWWNARECTSMMTMRWESLPIELKRYGDKPGKRPGRYCICFRGSLANIWPAGMYNCCTDYKNVWPRITVTKCLVPWSRHTLSPRAAYGRGISLLSSQRPILILMLNELKRILKSTIMLKGTGRVII